jgi:hypothetical protein
VCPVLFPHTFCGKTLSSSPKLVKRKNKIYSSAVTWRLLQALDTVRLPGSLQNTGLPTLQISRLENFALMEIIQHYQITSFPSYLQNTRTETLLPM